MGFVSYIKSIGKPRMRDAVSRVEIDNAGNMWYLSQLLGGRHKWRISFNMSSNQDKRDALEACTPLYIVADKVGTMMQRGEVYVTDDEGNEDKFTEWAEFLKNPNPLQTWASFVRDVEISLRLFGFCPIAVNRGVSTLPPSSMYVIRPELFHIEGSGRYYQQVELDGIIDRVFIQWGRDRINLQEGEYFIIHNGSIEYNPSVKELQFTSVADSLSRPVSNWMAAMSASNVLLTNGGPKGVLYNDYQDAMGNNPMTTSEKEEIHRRFNAKYGITGDKSPIFISPKKLGWLPMDFNADQLKLHEEDERCTAKICGAFGLNQNLFADAKYDNQESAKKAAYQDVIIPDSKVICEAITKHILPEGATMTLDFSDVECLQKSKKDEAGTLQTAANAVKVLLDTGLITFDEAREEISNYIEIDPSNPNGEFKVQEGKEGNDEQV